MVGRKKELNALQKALASDESEFVARYGRRRIGKTYLVREFFKIFCSRILIPFFKFKIIALINLENSIAKISEPNIGIVYLK